jgi:hypothetical protein
MAPSCYGDNYTPGMEVVDFFTRTVELFKVRGNIYPNGLRKTAVLILQPVTRYVHSTCECGHYAVDGSHVYVGGDPGRTVEGHGEPSGTWVL